MLFSDAVELLLIHCEARRLSPNTISWWNVKVTGSVISAEDRRLQQSLAALLIIQLIPNGDKHHSDDRFNGFRVTNHGKGLARDVKISLEYFNLVKARVDEKKLGVARKIELQRTTELPYQLSDSVDAIAERDHAVTWFGLEFGEIDDTTMTEFRNIRLSYLDMFGNPYETVYDDIVTYRWLPPKYLEIPPTRNIA